MVLDDVRLTSNKQGNDITISSVNDILVRKVSAGIYLESETDKPEIIDGDGNKVAYTTVSSSGDITLTAGGMITETSSDDGVDIVANRLTLNAKTGITGLEMAVNSLDAQTQSGDIELSEFDGALEKAAGMDVVRATTATGGTTNASITAENELRIGSGGDVSADTIRLVSTMASVVVVKPTDGDSLIYTRGVAFVAHDMVSLYRFFSAPDLMEYRAGDYFLFGVPK